MTNGRRGFLFDMDGTIANTMPYHVQAWTTLLAERGIAMEADAFLRRTSGKMNQQILADVLGIQLSEAELSAFDARKESLFRSLCRPHLAPIPGVPAFLAASRALGISMAVATAAGKANRDFTLEGLGIDSQFAAVVGAEDVRRGKPHPEIFLTAAERLGIPPERCLVFEDAPSGIEAAGRAGMRAVALTTSLSAADFLGHSAVCRIATDFTELTPRACLEAAGLRVDM